MKKLGYFILYSLLLVFLGKQLPFLPVFSFQTEKGRFEDKKEELMTLVSKEEGSYSVYYENLTTGRSVGLNDEKVLTGASLNKVFIVGYLYRLASQGKFDLEDRVTLQENDIQDYGTGSLRYEGKGKTYSFKSLAEKALRESDNTAAHVIALRVGRENVQKYIDSLGLKATDINNNTTSARDVALFFKLLYRGGVAGGPLDRELLGYLENTLFEDRLALFLKDKASVFHKSGDAVNMIHDAGIVEGGKDPYIIAVLSHDISNEKKTKVTLGEIAHLFFDSN